LKEEKYTWDIGGKEGRKEATRKMKICVVDDINID
jgi:hypothetical protein